MAAAGSRRGVDDDEERRVGLLHGDAKKPDWLLAGTGKEEDGSSKPIGRRVLEESKKLWEIVGPAMFMRLVLYSLNVISQAFAGHIGDLELAAFSIANTVVSGLTFGLLVCQHIPYNAS